MVNKVRYEKLEIQYFICYTIDADVCCMGAGGV